MKKIGSFFFTFIPFLLALVFQYLAMFFVMGVTLFYEHIRYIFSSNRIYADLWNKTLDLWSTTRVNTLIMIVFSLLCIGAFGFWYHAGYIWNLSDSSTKSFSSAFHCRDHPFSSRYSVPFDLSGLFHSLAVSTVDEGI